MGIEEKQPDKLLFIFNLSILVTVVGYSLKKSQKGEDYYIWIYQGGIEMIKSKVSEKYYAMQKKCSITSTFNEEFAKAIVGEKLSGFNQN
jgi:hypothetical protein